MNVQETATSMFERLQRSRQIKQMTIAAFAATGLIVAFGTFASGNYTPVATVEAENMDRPSGAQVYADTTASAGQAVRLNNNGTLTKRIDVPKANRLTIRARGVLCRGDTRMVVRLDNKQMISTSVKNAWTEYSVDRVISAGVHTLTVSFNNDTTRSDCSRALQVDKAVFLGTTSGATATPAATSSPAVSAVPAVPTNPQPLGSLFWNGDFSTGDWSQWDSADDDCRPQDHSVVTSPVPPGHNFASKHTVTADSTLNQSGTRCLVYNDPKSDPRTAKSHAYEGAESWYEDWIYFPSDFVPSPGTDWNWVWQLHNWPDGEGPVNLVEGVITDSSDGGPSGGERLSMRIIGGGSEANPIDNYGTGNYGQNPDVKRRWLRGPSIQRGHWYHQTVYVKWSRHDTGRVEYWLDGELIGSYDGPNLFYHASGGGYANPDHAGQAYYSIGYYRPRDGRPPATVYHAGAKVYAR